MKSRPRRSPVDWLLLDDAPVLVLVPIGAALVGFASWLLLSPDRLVSRQSSWDLLFILEGGWHVYNGQVAHVDFHHPVGSLIFQLTALGFRLGGLSVFALPIGEAIAAAVLFGAAIAAVSKRLPLLPSLLFVLDVCLLVLMPINLGEPIGDFTFAMAYNRIGAAGLAVVSLVLFLSPRGRSDRSWLDAAIVGGLMLGLYHLKITYFCVAVGEFAVAMLVCHHVRRHGRLWLVTGALVLLNAAAPYNWPYLADIWAGIQSGRARTNLAELVYQMSENVPEASLMAMMLIAAVALWLRREAPLQLAAGIAVLVAAGILVIWQNTQTRELNLTVAAALLLYDRFRGDPAEARRTAGLWLLAMLLVFPSTIAGRRGLSLVLHHRQAMESTLYAVADRTNLRGLAVPADPPGVLEAFDGHPARPELFGRVRAVDTGGAELSQFEYLQTLLEAAALFDDPELRDGAIMVIDPVSPLPFMIGRAPPKGANLFLELDAPWQPPASILGDVRYVLVPKFSSDHRVMEKALRLYGAYLAEHFADRRESASWVLLTRRP
jgi:hypothetical protein